MKKLLLIGLCLICLTGCSKEITCTKESKNQDYKSKTQIVYTYEKETIKEIAKKNTITFKSKDKAKEHYEQYNKTIEFQKEHGTYEEKKLIEKNKISQKNKKIVLEINYNEDEIVEEAKTNKEFSLNRKNFIKTFEKNGYKCK